MKILKIIFIIAIVYNLFAITYLIIKTSPEAQAQQIEIQYIEKIVEVPAKFEYQTFEVTAYTSGFESTGKTPENPAYGITASGEMAWEKITIACPPSMKFGTKIYIPALENIYTCQDRGSAITEGKLDIYIEDLNHALMFGRQHLEVIILP
jgi:3D (Asp-Asp-Asp) domain-containing protein